MRRRGRGGQQVDAAAAEEAEEEAREQRSMRVMDETRGDENLLLDARQRRVERFLQRRLDDRWAWLHRMLPAS